jgi:RNA polymerase sigma factor (sigma-70 family)
MKTNTSTEIEILLKQYKRYIIKIASTLTQDDYIKQELIQEGEISLYKAHINFNSTEGEFHPYVITYLRGAMLNYLTTNIRTIKVPANIVHHINRIEGEEFTKILSLDKTIGDEDSSTLGEMVEDHVEDNSLDDTQELIRALLKQYLSQLKAQWQIIIKLRYIEDMTLTDIGKEIGISTEAVRQQHDRAIDKLQQLFKNK